MNVTPIAAFTTDAQRWEALQQRDASADGHFFYGVRTTGVYCRPTCRSRLPRRANVEFFADTAAAAAAGFRPCKRCTPNTASSPQPHAAAIARACRQLDEALARIPLKDLAADAGLSAYHFHRVFKTIVGITPHAYATARRTDRLRDRLQAGDSVTDAVYDAGFASSSSFYEQSTDLLGMTPTQFRRGGIGMTIRYAIAPCWLGWVLVAATETGICAIALGDEPATLTAELHADFPHARLTKTPNDAQEPSDRTFLHWVDQAIALVQAPQAIGDLPLDVRGTAFQQQVWQALQAIPPGTTVSYGDVARAIGNPKAVRAVARACATNQLAVAIPCHRVVGGDGALRGYRWGQARKRALIDREVNSPQILGESQIPGEECSHGS